MILVNLFGGPCCAKSTTALGIASKLKAEGILSEYVREFAKDLVWQERFKELRNYQPWVSINQWKMISETCKKVDVVITDSPFILGAIYQDKINRPELTTLLKSLHDEIKDSCINIRIVRNSKYHPYDTRGRVQDYKEALEKDHEVVKLLKDFEIEHTSLLACASMEDYIVNLNKERLKVRP